MKKVIFVALLLLGNISRLLAQDLDAILQQGEQYNNEGKYTEALDYLKSREKYFENAEFAKYGIFLTSLGRIYIRLGLFSNAEKSLLKALSVLEDKISVDYAEVMNDLGTLYFQMGDFV